MTIGPNIVLQIGPGPTQFCNQTPIAPSTVDNSFCTGSNYKANQSTERLNIPDSNKIVKTNFNINLYPNPANSECTVRFTESAGADVTITLVDLMGRDIATLDHSWHDQGTSFVPFSTERYAPGVYSVRFSDGTNTSTQRLTISGR